MDQTVIDGILHAVGPCCTRRGSVLFRNYFDLPIINRFSATGSVKASKKLGRSFRIVQTGRIQQYLILALVDRWHSSVRPCIYYLLVFCQVEGANDGFHHELTSSLILFTPGPGGSDRAAPAQVTRRSFSAGLPLCSA